MPLPITETRLPLYKPVYPSIPRTVLKHTAFSKNVSAMNFALSGSPGIKTTFAISPFFASLCGVIKFSSRIQISNQAKCVSPSLQ